MENVIKGRLDVNWDSYWNGFIKIPMVEPLRFFLIKRACDRLMKPFKAQGKVRMCELGSGTGSVSRYLAETYNGIPTVVDNNPHALELCKKTFDGFAGELKVIERDVFNLKEYAGQFDLVHSGGLIEHFVDESRDGIIKLHCDLASANGYLMILVPVVNWWYRLLNYGIFKFLHLLDEIPEVPWTYQELEAALDRHGFKIVARTNVISEIGILAKRK